MPKLHLVTTSWWKNKKKTQLASKVIGFVSVFGWESADAKAAAKYAGYEGIATHEWTRPKRVK